MSMKRSDAAAGGVWPQRGVGSALLGFVKAQAYSYLVEMAFDWLKVKPGRKLLAQNVNGVVEVKFYEEGEEVSPVTAAPAAGEKTALPRCLICGRNDYPHLHPESKRELERAVSILSDLKAHSSVTMHMQQLLDAAIRCVVAAGNGVG